MWAGPGIMQPACWLQGLSGSVFSGASTGAWFGRVLHASPALHVTRSMYCPWGSLCTWQMGPALAMHWLWHVCWTWHCTWHKGSGAWAACSSPRPCPRANTCYMHVDIVQGVNPCLAYRSVQQPLSGQWGWMNLTPCYIVFQYLSALPNTSLGQVFLKFCL